MRDRHHARATPPGRFFIPGFTLDHDGAEAAYSGLRESATELTGAPPDAQRIFGLDCELGGRGYRVEVGLPDPLQGNVVLAIFDVGGERPYAVYTRHDASAPAFRLGRAVTSVIAFGPEPPALALST